MSTKEILISKNINNHASFPRVKYRHCSSCCSSEIKLKLSLIEALFILKFANVNLHIVFLFLYK